MPGISRFEILGMIPSIHVNHAIAMRTTNIENVDALKLWHVQHLEPIGRQDLTRPARRLASGVRGIAPFVSHAIVQECARPWLQWHIGEFWIRRKLNTRARIRSRI